MDMSIVPKNKKARDAKFKKWVASEKKKEEKRFKASIKQAKKNFELNRRV